MEDARSVESLCHRATVLVRHRAKGSSVRITTERHAVLDGQGLGALLLGCHEGDGARYGVAGPRAEAAALEPDVTFAGGEEAGEGPDEGRLSCCVRPDDGHGLARGEDEARPSEDEVAASRDGDAPGLEERAHSLPSFVRRA